MIHGALQDYPLTLEKIIGHAAKWHCDKQVVTASGSGCDFGLGYRDLAAGAKGISAELREDGLVRGECVATLAWNSAEHMACWYAIMGIGSVCHTLNPRLSADALASMLRQSQARIMVASFDQLALAEQIVAQGTMLETLFVIDGWDEIPASLAAAVRVQRLGERQDLPGIEWGGFDENLPCGLCFTSGTTGSPKGVTYTHRGNFLHTLRQLQADVSGITERDVVLPAVPMFHANAWGLPFSCPAVGATLVLPGRNTDGASLARLIVEHGVTIAAGVPTVWLDLFDHLDRERIEVPSLRRVMVGGAPMPAALSRRICDRGVEVQQTWGMTEISPLGTATRPEHQADSGNSGSPALGIDLLLFGHDGEPLDSQREQEGRLHVRGPSVVERYFGQEQAATSDGWFDTGDLAVIDECGALQITGRTKDLIKSGGEWVNPVEIEGVVGSLPQVGKVAVIARTHPKWGERPVMVVEIAEGATIADDDLLDPLRRQFARWWVPDAVIRVAQMPLAATGKIDKRELQNLYGVPA